MPRWLAAVIYGVLLAAAYCLISSPAAHAFVTLSGGDGFIPIVYQDRIFNIYHHQSLNGDPVNPTVDINCVVRATGAECPNYPRYFSSTVGSSGKVGLGTPGTADIYTAYYPHAVIEGSRLFYAAQRAADNGIGCFDLDLAVNCGYTQLGTLAWSSDTGKPARIDGVERVGNKLYSAGADLKMYCLDISNPASPVACTSQPYAVNTGITGQMPSFNNGTGLTVLREVIGGRIYINFNYNNHSPAANARITCFDPLTNARCAGWSSLEVTGTSSSPSRSLFEFPNTSGLTTAICAVQLLQNPVQCWDLTTLLSVSPPPNLFTGVTSSNSSTWIWDELRVNNRTYFALSAGGSGTIGMAVCYDFTAQARCAGFGSGGVKKWDGSDGDTAVNGGDTEDYGYAISQTCIYGLGNAGVLWSFDMATGAVSSGFSCALAPIAVAAIAGVPGATITPGLPNAGDSPREKSLGWRGVSATIIMASSVNYLIRKKHKLSNG